MRWAEAAYGRRGKNRGTRGTLKLERLEARVLLNGTVIYVDADAVGANDGSSWADAYEDLQDALGAVVATDEVWVAEGTYVPGADRADTFQLVEGVALYGGFGGGETLLEQRDWEANVTTLSGDINGDDVGFTNNDENVYHVLTGADDAILDGFTITGGNADGSDDNARGGGMFNSWASPTVENCAFIGNLADRGGGMYNEHGSVTVSDSVFSGNHSGDGQGFGAGICNDYATLSAQDCVFIDNTSSWLGGGVYNYSSTTNASDCVFTGNTALGAGGGLYTSDGNVINCVFAGNSSNGRGGGIYAPLGTFHIINSTFFGNTADQGGAIALRQFGEPTITNCILWGDTASDAGDEIYNEVTLTVSYSDIEGGLGDIANEPGGTVTDGGGNVDSDPLFVDSSDPHGPDGVFATEDDGLQLGPGSPAINSATASGAPATDILGASRPQGLGFDMGAYELDLGPALIHHVPTGFQLGGVAHVDVTFNEEINGATFTADDVIVIGPGGPIAPTSIAALGGNTFRISFAEQSAPGAYTFSVGPDIEDLAGYSMDQDQDGIGGEAVEDVYTGGFEIRLIDTRQSGDTVVSLYDVAGDVDIDPSDVLVRFGRHDRVAGIVVRGSEPMEGLGIAISGAPSVGNIRDVRRGTPAHVEFIASDAPIRSISLKAGISGYDLNDLEFGGLTLGDMDAWSLAASRWGTWTAMATTMI